MKLSITEQLQYSTVRIEVSLTGGDIATGTGFFFRLHDTGKQHIPVIITNKHVIENGKSATFYLTRASCDGTPQVGSHINIMVPDVVNQFKLHPEESIDLAALAIAPLFHEAKKQNTKFFFRALGKESIPTQKDEQEFTAVEDILMIGYPNGIWDRVNNHPIFRKGITATHPAENYNGREEFMIDAACFPGSSGSPVMLYNLGSYAAKSGGTILGSRIKFLGILYAGPQHRGTGEIDIVEIPTRETSTVSYTIPNNLGNVIKARKVLDFEKIYTS